MSTDETTPRIGIEDVVTTFENCIGRQNVPTGTADDAKGKLLEAVDVVQALFDARRRHEESRRMVDAARVAWDATRTALFAAEKRAREVLDLDEGDR